MIAIAQITEMRACFAVGTVKNRIRMCGMPAVPRTSAMPSEIWSIGLLRYSPGSRNRWPSSCGLIVLAASPNKPPTRAWIFGSPMTCWKYSGPPKPYCDQTRNTMTSEARTSRIALMICTHVVATMPPKIT